MNEQIVDIDLFARTGRRLLGVGDRGLDELLDEPRALLGREAQHLDGLRDVLTADEIRDQTRLLGADTSVTKNGVALHGLAYRTLALRSAACPRKVRVGANSPSLCPIICSVT